MPEEIDRRAAPDPTPRTLEALKERQDSQAALFSAKLDGVIDSQRAFQDNLTRVPTQLQETERKIMDLMEVKIQVLNGRFDRVEALMGERQEHSKEVGALISKALDAALATANETNARVERSATDQIKQLNLHVSSGVQGLSAKVDAEVKGLDARLTLLKETVNLAEGGFAGAKGVLAFIAALVGVGVGLIAGWRL